MEDKRINNIKEYRSFCKENNLPIFFNDWWLDAVSKDKWNVCIYKKNNDIIGCMPYIESKKIIFSLIKMPPLTSGLGPIIIYPTDAKYASKLGIDKKVCEYFISELPKFDNLTLRFFNTFTNWLPFYWKGSKQTTRYTYILKDIANPELIFNNFRDKTRNEIRKAEKKLTIEITDDINAFYKLNIAIFKRQNIPIPYSFELVKRIDDACKKRNCRSIYFAKDTEGNIHASAYIIWDSSCAYYLMSGANTEFRNSGGVSLVLWNAIKDSSKKVKSLLIPTIQIFD